MFNCIAIHKEKNSGKENWDAVLFLRSSYKGNALIKMIKIGALLKYTTLFYSVQILINVQIYSEKAITFETW